MNIFTIVLIILAGIFLGPWVFDLVGFIFKMISKLFYLLGDGFNFFGLGSILQIKGGLMCQI